MDYRHFRIPTMHALHILDFYYHSHSLICYHPENRPYILHSLYPNAPTNRILLTKSFSTKPLSLALIWHTVFLDLDLLLLRCNHIFYAFCCKSPPSLALLRKYLGWKSVNHRSRSEAHKSTYVSMVIPPPLLYTLII